MTEKIYFENPYEKEFEAKVVSIEGNKVVLNRTAFYPEGGGQPSDRGEIEGIKVIELQKDGENIIHVLEKEPDFKEGDTVKGTIDWDRRYKLMKVHTAAHLISHVIMERTGAEITGNQLEENTVRIDFNLEKMDKEVLSKAVEETNEIIQRGLDVKTYFLSREDAMKLPGAFRLKKAFPENIQMVRIVDIGGYDVQADGGIQVKNTEEVGRLEIVKFDNKGKNNRRIYVKVD